MFQTHVLLRVTSVQFRPPPYLVDFSTRSYLIAHDRLWRSESAVSGQESRQEQKERILIGFTIAETNQKLHLTPKTELEVWKRHNRIIPRRIVDLYTAHISLKLWNSLSPDRGYTLV